MLKRLGLLALGVALAIEAASITYSLLSVFVLKSGNAAFGDGWENFTFRLELTQLEVLGSCLGAAAVSLIARRTLRGFGLRAAFLLGCLVGLSEFFLRFINLFAVCEALGIRGSPVVYIVILVPGVVATLVWTFVAGPVWSRWSKTSA